MNEDKFKEIIKIRNAIPFIDGANNIGVTETQTVINELLDFNEYLENKIECLENKPNLFNRSTKILLWIFVLLSLCAYTGFILQLGNNKNLSIQTLSQEESLLKGFMLGKASGLEEARLYVEDVYRKIDTIVESRLQLERIKRK